MNLPANTSNLIALVSIILSALAGTGGIGYAIVQWWLKRHDTEAQANAARVLTDAAGGIIKELQQEKAALREEIQLMKDEVKEFRASVREFIEAVEDALPLFSRPELSQVKSSLRVVKSKM